MLMAYHIHLIQFTKYALEKYKAQPNSFLTILADFQRTRHRDDVIEWKVFLTGNEDIPIAIRASIYDYAPDR